MSKPHILGLSASLRNARSKAGSANLAAELAAKLDLPLTIGHVLQFGRPADELARMAEVEHLVRHVHQNANVEFPNVPDTMLNVFSDTRPAADSVIGEEIVKRAVARAHDMGVENVSTKTSQGDTADAILDIAETVGADMIVMGHRGLGRLKTALLGSVAQKVLQQAECTVVSVR